MVIVELTESRHLNRVALNITRRDVGWYGTSPHYRLVQFGKVARGINVEGSAASQHPVEYNPTETKQIRHISSITGAIGNKANVTFTQ